MLTTAIIELFSPLDANAWEKGCRDLGMGMATEPIKSETPKLADIQRFLASTPDWIFLSGHMGHTTLVSGGAQTALDFGADSVAITAVDGSGSVMKTSSAFGLHRQCKLSLWSGCSVCDEHHAVENVSTLFRLLGPHVLLGFAGTTGSKVTAALLGGGFIKSGHFFDNVKGHEADPTALRDAWLNAAIHGYRGGTGELHRSSPDSTINETLFRAVDPDGTVWTTRAGKRERIGRAL